MRFLSNFGCKIIFFLVSGLLAWYQKLCVCFFVCFIYFYFLNNLLRLYLKKKGSTLAPLSRQLIGIHRANLVYCH